MHDRLIYMTVQSKKKIRQDLNMQTHDQHTLYPNPYTIDAPGKRWSMQERSAMASSLENLELQVCRT